MKGMIFAILLISLLASVSAFCNSTQVDINSANATELDKIITVGPATAAKIVSARPFYSLDDLIKVSGIGNLTLNKIKSQGLACVVNEQNTTTQTSITQETQNNSEQIQTTSTPTATTPSGPPSNNLVSKELSYAPELEPINLSKNIKTQNGNEGNKKYAIYGFIGFCILLTILFILKKKTRKNEFR